MQEDRRARASSSWGNEEKFPSMHAPLYLTLCNPMDCGLPGSSVHGISQARILEWIAISSSRGSSPPRDRTAGRYFVPVPPGSPTLYSFFFCSFTDPLARATYSWTMLSGCLISDTAIGRVFQKSLGPALCPWADMRHYHLILQGSNWRPEKLNDHLKSFII